MTDFLSSLFSNIGGDILKGFTQGASDSISKAIFGRQDRISNRDYQFYQDLADSGNPREIRRQGQFLEGLAPSQAAAHNTYQDATYQEDTARATERIQSMGSELGMSPWEIMGQSGSTPLPTPAAPQNQGGQYLSQLAPLKIAEINAKTQLATAKLQSDTALKTTEMTTGAAKYGTDVGAETARTVANINTANGKVPVTQADLNAQQKMESMAREGLIYDQQRATNNRMYIETARTLAEFAGKTEFSIPGIYKRTSQNNAKGLSGILNLTGGDSSDEQISKYIAGMAPDEFAELNKDLQHIEEFIALGVAAGAKGAAGGVAGFLGGLFTEEHVERDDNSGKSSYTQRRRRFKMP